MQAPRIDLLDSFGLGEILASVRDGIDDSEILTSISLRARSGSIVDLEAGTYSNVQDPPIAVNSIRRIVGVREAADSNGALHVGDRVYLIDQADVTGDVARLWAERFESDGVDESWNSSVVSAGSGTVPTFDEDAAPPAGTSGWQDRSLRVTAVGDGSTGLLQAYRETETLPDASKYVVEWSNWLASESLAEGNTLAVLQLSHGIGSTNLVAAFHYRFPIPGEPGAGALAYFGYIHHDGSENKYGRLTSTDVEITYRFTWDLSTLSWSWEIPANEITIGSGTITGTPATEPWAINTMTLGIKNQSPDIPIDYYVDNLLITTGADADISLVDEIVDGEDVLQVVMYHADPLSHVYQIIARAA